MERNSVTAALDVILQFVDDAFFFAVAAQQLLAYTLHLAYMGVIRYIDRTVTDNPNMFLFESLLVMIVLLVD